MVEWEACKIGGRVKLGDVVDFVELFPGFFFNALRSRGIKPYLPWDNRNPNLSVALLNYSTNIIFIHQIQLCPLSHGGKCEGAHSRKDIEI